jgi:hypothetical protein
MTIEERDALYILFGIFVEDTRRFTRLRGMAWP